MATKQTKSQIVVSETNEPNEIEQLKNQIAELRKLVEESAKVKPERKLVKKTDIAPNEYIQVISLTNHELNLSTRPRGQGKLYNFKGYGEIKRIFYSDILDIMNNHPNFLEAGYFYILNRQVIEENGLNDLYEKILNKDQMENILNNGAGAVQLFESANPKQQKTIVDMMIVKLRDGGTIDFNLVSKITQLSGIDINAKVKDALEAMKYENEK